MLYSHDIYVILSTYKKKKSMQYFPSSLQANKPLKYSVISILLNRVGVCSLIKLDAEPTILSCLRLPKIATESLFCSQFTIARCSILRYIPFDIIYHVIKHATKTENNHGDVGLHKEERKKNQSERNG